MRQWPLEASVWVDNKTACPNQSGQAVLFIRSLSRSFAAGSAYFVVLSQLQDGLQRQLQITGIHILALCPTQAAQIDAVDDLALFPAGEVVQADPEIIGHTAQAFHRWGGGVPAANGSVSQIEPALQAGDGNVALRTECFDSFYDCHN